MWRYLLPVVPASAVAVALWRGTVLPKVVPPVVDALLAAAVAAGLLGGPRPAAGAVAVAFAVSAVGDYFMATRGTDVGRFMAGIGSFLVALLGYLLFAALEGAVNPVTLVALLVLLAGFVPYYFFALRPAIEAKPLAAAALVYLLVGSATLAAAIGVRLPAAPRALYAGGVALLVFSDTIISMVVFLRREPLAWLIHPTYYLGQLAILASLLGLSVGT